MMANFWQMDLFLPLNKVSSYYLSCLLQCFTQTDRENNKYEVYEVSSLYFKMGQVYVISLCTHSPRYQQFQLLKASVTVCFKLNKTSLIVTLLFWLNSHGLNLQEKNGFIVITISLKGKRNEQCDFQCNFLGKK